MEQSLKKLHIISANVNSIITNSRRYNLLKFLEQHHPDVALLGETKLNNSHKLSFQDYAIVRQDRPNATQGLKKL